MERLTEKIGNTNCVKGCGSNCKYGFQHCNKEDWENCQTIDDIIDKLADYEDLEEQNRLVKLPCKVGDTLYSALGEKVLKSEVISVKYHCEAENHGVFIRERIIIDTDDFETEINFSDIGETVFLTKSEAEQKLKEMERD